jgi:hypothetical protein
MATVELEQVAAVGSMLFVFAYVDLFSLYRPDFRAAVEAGEIGGFTVNQSFLLGVNRIANIALSTIYALTITAAAIGEWNYFILGSAIESHSLQPSAATRGPGRKQCHQFPPREVLFLIRSQSDSWEQNPTRRRFTSSGRSCWMQ